SMVYSQLVRFPNGPEQKHPADFTIVPDLAEKWTVSKDGTVYTFQLRKGVKFHNRPPVNGREVTAADVKYSIERFMAKSAFKARFQPVQSVDHLATPPSTPILAREVEEKFKDFNHPDGVIGTGPFVLKSYERGVRLVFDRNPDYFMKGLA